MLNTTSYRAGLLNHTQFGKITTEVGNIVNGDAQPMGRTSPAGNIIGGVLGSQPGQATTPQPTASATTGPTQRTHGGQTTYTGSNPVTNAQARQGGRP